MLFSVKLVNTISTALDVAQIYRLYRPIFASLLGTAPQLLQLLCIQVRNEKLDYGAAASAHALQCIQLAFLLELS